MPGLLQRIFTPPACGEAYAVPQEKRYFRVLIVTADDGFYAGVLRAADSIQCATGRAGTFHRAVEMCRSRSQLIVIYDGDLPDVPWETAFGRLRAVTGEPRILLAAGSVDEALWMRVLTHRGYDAVERSASSAQLTHALRFAWLSLLAQPNVPLPESGGVG